MRMSQKDAEALASRFKIPAARRMTDLINTLCERLAQGLDRDPQRLADSLGTARAPAAPGLPIKVTPSNPCFSAADVFADDNATSMVSLVPAQLLTLGTLASSLGAFEESPRLHPHDPRKLVFSPDQPDSHPFTTRVVAYVAANETIDTAASVQKVTIICSARNAGADTVAQVTASGPVLVWSRLHEDAARFEIRAWRTYSLTTLDDIRTELEEALGIHFVASHHANEPAYLCTMRACELRLSARPSENERLQIFTLIGVPSGSPDTTEDISEALAAHLRAADDDWYVPSDLERRAETLDQELLDRDTLVSLIAPRWLAWSEGDDRDTALGLLEGIADLWLTAARRTSDPVADVKWRKAEFQGWARYFPRKRTTILFSYAVQAQLGLIEEELFELSLMTPVERATRSDLGRQLAEWREAVLSLDEAVQQTRVPEIRLQYTEVVASIDVLLAETTVEHSTVLNQDWVRIVLASDENEDKLVAVAGKNNWGLRKIIAKSENQPAERIYATRDRATQIHWIEDDKIGVVYLYVQGPEASSIEALLRKKLRNYSSASILERARDSTLEPGDRRQALYHLALDKMERGFDPETFDIYAKAMRDPDLYVRGSAVLGSAYLGWPQLAEPMRPLTTEAEPDKGIRKDAALLLSRLAATTT